MKNKQPTASKTKAICIESLDLASRNPKVQVVYHVPNWESLYEDVQAQIDKFPFDEIGAAYFNPLGTVTCDQPTEEFFRRARKLQGQWCKRYQTVLGRSVMKGVKSWCSAYKCKSRQDTFIKRENCMTGVLYISGEYVFPNQWPDIKQSKHNSINRTI